MSITGNGITIDWFCQYDISDRKRIMKKWNGQGEKGGDGTRRRPPGYGAACPSSLNKLRRGRQGERGDGIIQIATRGASACAARRVRYRNRN